LATMPARFAKMGDPHAAIDRHAGSLDALLELSARQEKEGQGDAPWPPHYRKQPGEPPRVQPSKARARAQKYPLIEVSKGKNKKEALAGFAKWKRAHARIARHLEPADVLVDQMRGRFTAWYRIRVNLQHVPEKLRPRTPSRARTPE
jgi:bifunctional non-homologous end joining protein LigD